MFTTSSLNIATGAARIPMERGPPTVRHMIKPVGVERMGIQTRNRVTAPFQAQGIAAR